MAHQSAQQTLGFRTRFSQLLGGTRVGDDAGAGAKFKRCTVRGKSPDEDIEVATAVEIYVAERTGICAAAAGLELRNDLHGADLGAACNRAARAESADDGHRR